MYQQDHLLSCQLRPTFPPAWKECGVMRLTGGATRLQMGIVHSTEGMVWDKIHTQAVDLASANQSLSHH